MEFHIVSSKISELGIKNVKIYNSESCICIYSFFYNIKIKRSNYNELYIFSNSYLGSLFQFFLSKKYREYIKNMKVIEDILVSNGFLILKIHYFPN